MATSTTASKSKKKSKNTNEGATKKFKKDFQWTDDESELLLHVTYEYKTAKSMENIDWESVKSKYDDIYKRFKAVLPDNPPSASERELINCGLAKDYPHTKQEVTKQIITTKLKGVRIKYRKAVDSGRRSGNGRVVLLYYELCEKVWGGSPATEQLESGLESTQIADDPNSRESSPLPNEDHSVDPSVDPSHNDEEDDSHSEPEESTSSYSQAPSPATVHSRRHYLDKKLQEHKQEKLKRKLPVDSQLLDCAQEDLKIKKRLIEQMERQDKQYTDSISSMSKNMEKLTESIADGFSLLRNMLYSAQPPMSYGPPGYNYMPYSAPNIPSDLTPSRSSSYPPSNDSN